VVVFRPIHHTFDVRIVNHSTKLSIQNTPVAETTRLATVIIPIAPANNPPPDPEEELVPLVDVSDGLFSR
jgi:hypothetical protein